MENSVTNTFNTHLSGATLLGVRMADRQLSLEGGLVYVFKKDEALATIIVGYNDLGEWVDYLSIGGEVVIDTICDEVKNNLIKEYVTAIEIMYEAGQVL